MLSAYENGKNLTFIKGFLLFLQSQNINGQGKCDRMPGKLASRIRWQLCDIQTHVTEHKNIFRNVLTLSNINCIDLSFVVKEPFSTLQSIFQSTQVGETIHSVTCLG